MKLALVIGEKQGNMIKPRLVGIKDNLDIDIYDTVPKFIDSALKRNCIYDRILTLGTMVNTRIISDLYTYWSNTSKETNIVLLARKGKDEDLCNELLNKFVTPAVAVMLVENTTVQIMAEAVLLPTHKITEKYGISDFLNVEVDDDSDGFVYQAPESETQPEPEEVKEPEPQPRPEVNEISNEHQEKRSLFGALFGKSKKKTRNQSGVAPQPVVSNTPVQDNFTEQESFQEFNEQDSFVNEPAQEQDSNVAEENIENFDNYLNSDDFDYGFEDTSSNEEVENNEINNEDPTETSDNNESYDDYTVNISDSDFEDDSNSEDFSNINVEEPSPVEQTEVAEDFSTSNSDLVEVDESFDSTNIDNYQEEYHDYQQLKNAFEPELEVVDEDFGNDIADNFNKPEEDEVSVSYKSEAQEVTEDLANLGVAGDEANYRKSNEQPRVVTNTVIKEVVRNINVGNKLVTLNNIFNGRANKILVVTGDRGTGITSTALNVARVISEKVPVLYMDCDIEKHGLLNYIDYDSFRNYSGTHMQGVKLCKSSLAFNNCVVSYDHNFDILTTDFSCEATEDDIQKAQEVVAERALDYGVVIVDCPVDKLKYIPDLLLTGSVILCVEASRRGFMNMLCSLEDNDLPMRYKRGMVMKGTMFLTKNTKQTDVKKLLKYINSIFQPSGADWLQMNYTQFNGKLSNDLLNSVLEK